LKYYLTTFFERKVQKMKQTTYRALIILGVGMSLVLSLVGTFSLAGTNQTELIVIGENMPLAFRGGIKMIGMIFSSFWAIISMLVFLGKPLRVEHVYFPETNSSTETMLPKTSSAKKPSWPYSLIKRK
jgi:hypothetical protein